MNLLMLTDSQGGADEEPSPNEIALSPSGVIPPQRESPHALHVPDVLPEFRHLVLRHGSVQTVDRDPQESRSSQSSILGHIDDSSEPPPVDVKQERFHARTQHGVGRVCFRVQGTNEVCAVEPEQTESSKPVHGGKRLGNREYFGSS